MATIQEIDAQIAALEEQNANLDSRAGNARLRKQINALKAQRYNLTVSDAELNARVAAAQQASEQDSRGAASNAKKVLAPLVAEQKKREATATLANSSSTSAQKWAARQVTNPIIAQVEDNTDGGHGTTATARKIAEQNKGKTIISEEQQTLANAHAAQNTPTWQAAVNAYNTGGQVPNEFVPLLNKLNAYFQQGQAAPGTLTPTLAGEALRQWGIDAQPGGFDKFMGVALPIAAGVLTGGIGGIGAIGGLTGAGAAAAGGAVAGGVRAGMQGGGLGDIAKGAVTGGALAYGGGMLADYAGLGSTAGTTGDIAAQLSELNPALSSVEAMNAAEAYTNAGYSAASLGPAVTQQTMLNVASSPTSTGNTVLDQQLTSAVQTGSMPVEAANQYIQAVQTGAVDPTVLSQGLSNLTSAPSIEQIASSVPTSLPSPPAPSVADPYLQSMASQGADVGVTAGQGTMAAQGMIDAATAANTATGMANLTVPGLQNAATDLASSAWGAVPPVGVDPYLSQMTNAEYTGATTMLPQDVPNISPGTSPEMPQNPQQLTKEQVTSLRGNPEAIAQYAQAGMIPADLMSTLGTAAPTWIDYLSTGLGLAQGIQGILGGNAQDAGAAQRALDPFAPYRAQYAQQLNQLMANPSTVTSLPGYQFQQQQGQQAIERSLAAQGRTVSGQEQLELQKYGQGLAGQAYTDQYNKLAQLSGANQGPGAGGTAYNNATAANQQQQQAGWTGLTQMAGQAATPGTATNSAVTGVGNFLSNLWR